MITFVKKKKNHTHLPSLIKKLNTALNWKPSNTDKENHNDVTFNTCIFKCQ